MSIPFKYEQAYQNSPYFTYGPNGRLLFALTIKFNLDDDRSLAASCLTDGPADKKIDAVFIDPDELQLAVIIQAYESSDRTKPEAPLNKASDLNTAVTWALNQPIAEVPVRLRPSIESLRDGISQKKIRRLEFWYVHNLSESMTVGKELSAVTSSAVSALRANYPDSSVDVKSIEVGNSVIEDWFLDRSRSIVITDEFDIGETEGYEIRKPDWNSYATFIPAKWLYELFTTHKEKLFSADIRGYLGSRRSDANINQGIKQTCEKDPSNFWVYNNGITCLVNKYTLEPVQGKTAKKLKVYGLAIVNGAQTTGAIGSTSGVLSNDALVPTRFIECQNSTIIENIIRYNNSQNKISAADFRSNDTIQTRLRIEFASFRDVTYKGRRGGSDDVMRRPSNHISSDTVAQALAAFHGNPDLAYNRRSEIWEEDKYYSQYFSARTTAKHIIFVYSLLRALQGKKEELRSSSDILTRIQNAELEMFRQRGSVLLVVSAIGHCLDSILSQRLAEPFKLSFGVIKLQSAIETWKPIIEATLPFSSTLIPALEKGLSNDISTGLALNEFAVRVESVKEPNKKQFSEFTSKVSFE